MNPVTVNQESCAIVYDADVLPEADTALFDVAYWRAVDAVQGEAVGRGTTWFITAPFGEIVLRRYLRGGWMGKVNHDRYWFNGVDQSRPFREFDVLRRMSADGLNVPVPVGALCERAGLAYRAALLTQRIPAVSALADRLMDESLDWSDIGRQLRVFHDAGMNHADLNARNIMLHNDTAQLWVLDLDSSTYQAGEPVDGTGNLQRLHRSLEKLWPTDENSPVALAKCWPSLQQGYGG